MIKKVYKLIELKLNNNFVFKNKIRVKFKKKIKIGKNTYNLIFIFE